MTLTSDHGSIMFRTGSSSCRSSIDGSRQPEPATHARRLQTYSRSSSSLSVALSVATPSLTSGLPRRGDFTLPPGLLGSGGPTSMDGAGCSGGEVAGYVADRLAAKGLSPHRLAASLRGSARSELSYGRTRTAWVLPLAP